MDPVFDEKARRLQGPVLVLGASGFIGANLFRGLLQARRDVFGTASKGGSWRLEGCPKEAVVVTDLLVPENLKGLLERVRPRTVFDCTAYGAYSFETDHSLIYRTNLGLTADLLERLAALGVAAYVHAGSSSEYGDLAAGPAEDAPRQPNSHYAVSKAAAADLIGYFGRKKGLPCANLRLYSVYGPWEDAARLVPALVMEGLKGGWPPLVEPEVSRDFIHVDDACAAFVDAALALKPELWGRSYNIGSGQRTRLRDLAATARAVFGQAQEPAFATMPNRAWDVSAWYADPRRAQAELGWRAAIGLEQGLRSTADWVRGLGDLEAYARHSKRLGLDEVHSVSAVIACYKDGQAIPLMHQRLKAVFEKLGIAHEIIFVNDASPDDSEEAIRAISARDRSVLGITHSRNFGSQAAFRSGMRAATKNAVVLLDGDLQDPPELIEAMVAKWREGYDVVYGVRVKREATLFMRWAYKAFYRVFDRLSPFRIPHDAGDFSLMDRKVVKALLAFPERDLFVRGLRAFAGFRQAGVDYVRPERAFGRSTNNLWRNIGWAKKGILSFSNTPLELLSLGGVLLLGASLLMAAYQVVYRLLMPGGTPPGVTTTLLLIIFFGSVNLLAVSVVGEYIAKILEEVKQRPHYIRRHLVKDGEVRDAGEDA
jgi:nucleoside-diphosphate-sugar epimerase/glycosyltransferase involved in cell wall biosynthesis